MNLNDYQMDKNMNQCMIISYSVCYDAAETITENEYWMFSETLGA